MGERRMSRYFFDVISHEGPQYDFCGRELTTPEAAYQFAEILAIDVETLHAEAASSCEIVVRNAEGRHFFSVPVRRPEPELVLVQSAG
jgi:hypothetical protein